MYLLGYDIGSSSIKATLMDVNTGKALASATSPKTEMEIMSPKPGWAEQHPDTWWHHIVEATKEINSSIKINTKDISAIGISYQMHGLVLVDKEKKVLRPSIIWCDSRAVETGNKAFEELGANTCLPCYLNSPGNFTASKLKWVKENEPTVYEKIFKVMLPGDYIAMKLTGEIKTTVSGLSEGIMWDFSKGSVADKLLHHYGIDPSLIPEIVPTFSVQGELSSEAAKELGLSPGIKIAYRAGDQPNNAFSLNVLNPGEIAATAGTSGVVYGVSGEIKYDPLSRVNTFAHVNHTKNDPRLGVLLCINGTGILNSWVKRNCGFENSSYVEMDEAASKIAVGSEGLSILPFGNGAERMLGNKNLGSQISGLNFNIHSKAHIARAAQEGIVFSFHYGMEIMKQTGIAPKFIRAGKANMFLSAIFRNTLANLSGAVIELYDTDGSLGAARGAGIGSGVFKNSQEAFTNLQKLQTIEPDLSQQQIYLEAYERWLAYLNKQL